MKIIAFSFPPHPSYVATLPENTLATEPARCFPLGGRLWKDYVMIQPTQTDKFQYSLKFCVLTAVCLLCTCLTDPELTCSAGRTACGLMPPPSWRLLIEHWSSDFLTASEDCSVFGSNFYTVYCLRRYNSNQNIVFSIKQRVYRRSTGMKICHFCYQETLQSEVSMRFDYQYR